MPATWLPCPTLSSGASPAGKVLAPINLLLQVVLGRSHLPLHLAGGGGTPLSLNEGWFRAIPVSKTPIIIPLP
ncbi:hypothetical protein LguiB_028768 [Lonicera macranthoides]